MKKILPIVFLFASFYVGFAGDTAHVGQEDDKREVLFRYQIDHNSSGQGKRAAVYCLSIGEKGISCYSRGLVTLAGNGTPRRVEASGGCI
jgi:hypothetical protein